MKSSGQFALATVTAWSASLVGGLLALAVVRFLNDRLGVDGYGLVSLAFSIVGISMVSDLGMRFALTRHLSEQFARQDDQRANELFSSALVVYLALSVAPITVCILATDQIVGFFEISPRLQDGARFLVRYYATVSIFLTFFAPAYQGVLVALHKIHIHDLNHIATVLVRTALIFLVVGLTDWGLRGWAAAMIAGQAVGIGLNWFYAHRAYPALRARLSLVRWDAVQQLFRLGSSLLANQAAMSLAQRTDPMVLTKFLGETAAGLYQPSQQLHAAPFPFVNALGRQVAPVATGLHVAGDVTKLRTVLVDTCRYTFLMGIPVCVLLAVFAHPLVAVWLGPGRDATAWALVAWQVADLCEYAGGGVWQVLIGMNRVRFITTVRLVTAVFNLLASILLVWWLARAGYGMLGIVGVIVPTAIGAVVQRVILTVYIARTTGLGVGQFVAAAYGRTGLVLVAMVLVAGTLEWSVAPRALVPLIGCMAVGGLAWLPLCWWVAFDTADRRRFWRIVEQGRARLRGAPRAPHEHG